MKHYALLGEHLGHSLSAPIHEAIFEALGIDADYRLIELPRADFAAAVPRLLQELDGFNITIPYKREILPHLRGLDAFAASVGAVNTVTCADGLGHNTDAPGFAAMLRHAGIEPAGLPCWILGTGGAAAAASAALHAMGAASVTMCSRRPAGAAVSYDTLAERFSGVLVNCTPAGMWPDTAACPLTPAQLAAVLPRAAGVADVIYNPAETALTAAAKAAGIPACTGLYMLVAQAAEAERLWQGRDLPEELCETIAARLAARFERRPT